MSRDTFPTAATRNAAPGHDEGDVARTDDIPFDLSLDQPCG
ncbi:hypothetical protein [Kitasatospora brasiliensis]|nr:hypothetical protein [Kitasatospora sp. K002]